MKNDKLLDLKKKRDGSWILYLNTDLVIGFFAKIARPVINIFELIDRLSKFSFLLMFIGSIGLGFGMGIIVFSSPSRTTAHFSQNQSLITPKQLIWLDEKFAVEKKSDPGVSLTNSVEVFYQPAYGQINQGQPLVFYSHNLPMMEQTQLGMPIQVIGDNNGIYSYSVVEIRYIKREELPNLIAKSGNSLIIYQTDDLLSSQLLVVIASKK